jgi:hypothetical protein
MMNLSCAVRTVRLKLADALPGHLAAHDNRMTQTGLDDLAPPVTELLANRITCECVERRIDGRAASHRRRCTRNPR